MNNDGKQSGKNVVIGGECYNQMYHEDCPWITEYLPVYDNGHLSDSWVLLYNETLGGGWGHGSYLLDFE